MMTFRRNVIMLWGSGEWLNVPLNLATLKGACFCRASALG
jgi:hypothetical protein